MKSKSLSRTAWATGFILATGVLILSGLLHHDLEKETRLAARRLKEPTEILLQKAYRSKDDLAAQEDVAALARASGVSFACVLDRDEKILAHSRIAQLGKPFHFPRSTQDIYSFALRDEQSRWGTLVFAMSGASARALWLKQVMALGAGAVLLFVGFMAWLFVIDRKGFQLVEQAIKREALLADEKLKVQKLEERLARVQAASALMLQSAVALIEDGVILLDERQRVIAANHRATEAYALGEPAALLGRSWCELPAIEPLNHALELSLQSPGIWIGQDPALSSLAGNHGTWMRFRESKSVK